MNQMLELLVERLRARRADVYRRLVQVEASAWSCPFAWPRRGHRWLLRCCYDPNNGFVTSLCYSYLEL